MSWLSRFKNALNSRRLDRDLAAELADHLERRAAAFKDGGVSAEDAERQARVRFGNPTRLREDARRFHLWAGLEQTLQDLRYAWRGIRKGPAFAATAILSLALAIGANTSIYSIVDAAILRPLPVPTPERLFVLTFPGISEPGSAAPDERQSFSYPEYLRFAEVAKPAARLLLASSPQRVEAQPLHSGRAEKINRSFISGDGFDVLGVPAALGKLFSSEDDSIAFSRPVAVLSNDYWRRRFGSDPHVVGQYLKIEGKAYAISGVAREGFFGVEPGKFVDVWLPGTQYEKRALTQLGWNWFRILGRLSPGVSTDLVQARLQVPFHDFQVQRMSLFRTVPLAIRKQFLENKIRVSAAPSGTSDLRKGFSRPLWIVFGVAAGILLIACANVASLLLARSQARAAEMAMRVSLGAGRARLIRQLLTEGLLLSLLAGALGWLLARGIAPALVNLLSTANDPAQFVLAIDTRALLFCVIVSTTSTLLFGLVPAWQASGVHPILSQRSFMSSARRLRLGKAFVSTQVACAFSLVLVGAAFLLSLINLWRVNPGFDPHNLAVLYVAMPEISRSDDPVAWNASHPGEKERLRNVMADIQRRVRNLPGVEAVALAWWPIFQGGGWTMPVIIPGKGSSDREEIFYPVSAGYFSALRTPLLAGHDFMPGESSGGRPRSVIVNEAFARRYFGTSDVVGREFSYPPPRLPSGSSAPVPVRVGIVGVAGDSHYYTLRAPADPMVYLPIDPNQGFTLYVRSTLNLGLVTRLVEREARAAGPGTQLGDVTTMDTIVGNTLLREKLLAGLGGTFAAFGLLLAAIGLFGLLSYSVGRRRKEFGIRAALGARRSEIVSLVLRDIATIMSVGLTVGLASALAVMALFRSLLFGIQKIDSAVIGSAMALFLFTALAAAWLPAYRAAMSNPMRSLREE